MSDHNVEMSMPDDLRKLAIKRCPRCDSPSPNLHPAVQAEGEVQPCPHAWHYRLDSEGRCVAHKNAAPCEGCADSLRICGASETTPSSQAWCVDGCDE